MMLYSTTFTPHQASTIKAKKARDNIFRYSFSLLVDDLILVYVILNEVKNLIAPLIAYTR
jgi:hypothetical protein